MTYRMRKHIALTVCLLFATGVALNGSDVVLCIGDCGHSSLETKCLSQPTGQDHAGRFAVLDEARGDHSHCGYCSDLSVDRSQWLRRSRLATSEQTNVTIPAYAASAIMVPCTSPGDAGGSGGARSALPQMQTLAAKASTTVLQC